MVTGWLQIRTTKKARSWSLNASVNAMMLALITSTQLKCMHLELQNLKWALRWKHLVLLGKTLWLAPNLLDVLWTATMWAYRERELSKEREALSRDFNLIMWILFLRIAQTTPHLSKNRYELSVGWSTMALHCIGAPLSGRQFTLSKLVRLLRDLAFTPLLLNNANTISLFVKDLKGNTNLYLRAVVWEPRFGLLSAAVSSAVNTTMGKFQRVQELNWCTRLALTWLNALTCTSQKIRKQLYQRSLKQSPKSQRILALLRPSLLWRGR